MATKAELEKEIIALKEQIKSLKESLKEKDGQISSLTSKTKKLEEDSLLSLKEYIQKICKEEISKIKVEVDKDYDPFSSYEHFKAEVIIE